MNPRASATALHCALLLAGLSVGHGHAEERRRSFDDPATLGPQLAIASDPAAPPTAGSAAPGAPAAALTTATGNAPAIAPGRTPVADAANPNADRCADDEGDDDPKAEVHGDVDAGVVGGNRVSGNYQAATVNWSRAFGCGASRKWVSLTVHVSQGRFRSSRGGRW